MKKLIILLLFPFFCWAQSGILKESLSVKSQILAKEVKYSIYLPSDYESSNRSYPVLYLLHGYGDDETGWTQFGSMQHIADETINSGKAPQMIIVMPDASATWYLNSFDGKVRYEDFLVKEFIPQIESIYRIRSKKEFRAVAGLSMGGFGTLLLATKHPEMFSAAAPLSASVRTDEEWTKMEDQMWNTRYNTLYGPNLKGKDRLNEHYNNNSILKIVEKGNLKDLKSVRYYIDCGDDDHLIKGNMALHAAMIDKGVPHEFRVRDGGHTWIYWRTALPEVLKFVGESFHR